MTQQQALQFAEEMVTLIRKGHLLEARRRFDGVWNDLYPELDQRAELSEMRVFFYILGELLTWPEAVRNGFASEGLLMSEYADMLDALGVTQK